MIEILISSTVLILIICGIRTFWKGKINLHLQYALWLLVVIRLLPFGLIIQTTNLELESPISIMSTFHHLNTILNSDTNAITQNDLSTKEASSNNNSDISSITSIQSSDTNLNTQTHNSLQTNYSLKDKYNLALLKTIVKIVWHIGMLLSAVWIVYVNIHFQNKIKKDRKLLEHVTCKLPVYESSSIHSPMLLMVHGRFGIYVTKACECDDSKMKHALTHELCHYKHLDYLWSYLRCFLLIIYWFNPFVWLAAILSKRDCELSCDASALKILGDEERFSYGRTILEFVSVHTNPSKILNIATGMSESKSGMKERIHRITKKSKMMLGTCITISLIVVVAIIITFTTSPKNVEGSSSPQKMDSNTDEKNSLTTDDTNKDTNTDDLSKLLEDQAKDFDTGYYFNGEQFITPEGPIKSLSGFTDDIIVNKYFGKNVWGEIDRTLENGFSKSFSKLQGVCYWLTINAKEDSSITINYSTTADSKTLKTLVVLPDKTTVELKNGEENSISLPQGKSEITIIAYDAVGEVNVSYSNLTDAVNIQNLN